MERGTDIGRPSRNDVVFGVGTSMPGREPRGSDSEPLLIHFWSQLHDVGSGYSRFGGGDCDCSENMMLSLGDITSGACESFGEACAPVSIITPGAPVSTSYQDGDTEIAPLPPVPAPANTSLDSIWLLALGVAGGLYYWFKLRKK